MRGGDAALNGHALVGLRHATEPIVGNQRDAARHRHGAFSFFLSEGRSTRHQRESRTGDLQFGDFHEHSPFSVRMFRPASALVRKVFLPSITGGMTAGYDGRAESGMLFYRKCEGKGESVSPRARLFSIPRLYVSISFLSCIRIQKDRRASEGARRSRRLTGGDGSGGEIAQAARSASQFDTGASATTAIHPLPHHFGAGMVDVQQSLDIEDDRALGGDSF